MPIEKTEKVNLVIAPSLWKRLVLSAAQVGHSRAEFIRLVLAAAVTNPQIYLPRAAQPQQAPRPDTSGLFRSAWSQPAPVAPPPEKPQPVFDEVAGVEWYKKGRVKGMDRAAAIAYARRCTSWSPKDWQPPDDDTAETAAPKDVAH